MTRYLILPEHADFDNDLEDLSDTLHKERFGTRLLLSLHLQNTSASLILWDIHATDS